MAHFQRPHLKRSIINAVSLVEFTTEFQRSFKPTITSSYVEYEDIGYNDTRSLFFSVWYYNRKLHKRSATQRVGIPLCLFLEFAKALRAYDCSHGKIGELATLYEYNGSSKRVSVCQERDRFVLKRQIFKFGVWTDLSILAFQANQIQALKNFIKHFGINHKADILASIERGKSKQVKWESTPAR